MVSTKQRSKMRLKLRSKMRSKMRLKLRSKLRLTAKILRGGSVSIPKTPRAPRAPSDNGVPPKTPSGNLSLSRKHGSMKRAGPPQPTEPPQRLRQPIASNIVTELLEKKNSESSNTQKQSKTPTLNTNQTKLENLTKKLIGNESFILDRHLNRQIINGKLIQIGNMKDKTKARIEEILGDDIKNLTPVQLENIIQNAFTIKQDYIRKLSTTNKRASLNNHNRIVFTNSKTKQTIPSSNIVQEILESYKPLALKKVEVPNPSSSSNLNQQRVSNIASTIKATQISNETTTKINLNTPNAVQSSQTIQKNTTPTPESLNATIAQEIRNKPNTPNKLNIAGAEPSQNKTPSNTNNPSNLPTQNLSQKNINLTKIQEAAIKNQVPIQELEAAKKRNTELNPNLSKLSQDIAIIQSEIAENKKELANLKLNTPELETKLQAIASARFDIKYSEEQIKFYRNGIERVNKQIPGALMARGKEWMKIMTQIKTAEVKISNAEKEIGENKKLIAENEKSPDIIKYNADYNAIVNKISLYNKILTQKQEQAATNLQPATNTQSQNIAVANQVPIKNLTPTTNQVLESKSENQATNTQRQNIAPTKKNLEPATNTQRQNLVSIQAPATNLENTNLASTRNKVQEQIIQEPALTKNQVLEPTQNLAQEQIIQEKATKINQVPTPATNLAPTRNQAQEQIIQEPAPNKNQVPAPISNKNQVPAPISNKNLEPATNTQRQNLVSIQAPATNLENTNLASPKNQVEEPKTTNLAPTKKQVPAPTPASPPKGTNSASNNTTKLENKITQNSTEIETIQSELAKEKAQFETIKKPQFISIDEQIKENEQTIREQTQYNKEYEENIENIKGQKKNAEEIINNNEKEIITLTAQKETPDIINQITKLRSDIISVEDSINDYTADLTRYEFMNKSSTESIRNSTAIIENLKTQEGYSNYVESKNKITAFENNLQEKQTSITENLRKLEELEESNKKNPEAETQNKLLTPEAAKQKYTELNEKLSESSQYIALIQSNIDKNKTELEILKQNPEFQDKLQAIDSARSNINKSEKIVEEFNSSIENLRLSRDKFKFMSPEWYKADDVIRKLEINKNYADINISVNNELIAKNENSSDIRQYIATNNNITSFNKILEIKQKQNAKTQLELNALQSQILVSEPVLISSTVTPAASRNVAPAPVNYTSDYYFQPGKPGIPDIQGGVEPKIVNQITPVIKPSTETVAPKPFILKENTKALTDYFLEKDRFSRFINSEGSINYGLFENEKFLREKFGNLKQGENASKLYELARNPENLEIMKTALKKVVEIKKQEYKEEAPAPVSAPAQKQTSDYIVQPEIATNPKTTAPTLSTETVAPKPFILKENPEALTNYFLEKDRFSRFANSEGNINYELFKDEQFLQQTFGNLKQGENASKLSVLAANPENLEIMKTALQNVIGIKKQELTNLLQRKPEDQTKSLKTQSVEVTNKFLKIFNPEIIKNMQNMNTENKKNIETNIIKFLQSEINMEPNEANYLKNYLISENFKNLLPKEAEQTIFNIMIDEKKNRANKASLYKYIDTDKILNILNPTNMKNVDKKNTMKSIKPLLKTGSMSNSEATNLAELFINLPYADVKDAILGSNYNLSAQLKEQKTTKITDERYINEKILQLSQNAVNAGQNINEPARKAYINFKARQELQKTKNAAKERQFLRNKELAAEAEQSRRQNKAETAIEPKIVRHLTVQQLFSKIIYPNKNEIPVYAPENNLLNLLSETEKNSIFKSNEPLSDVQVKNILIKLENSESLRESTKNKILSELEKTEPNPETIIVIDRLKTLLKPFGPNPNINPNIKPNNESQYSNLFSIR